MEQDELEKIYIAHYSMILRYLFALCKNYATAQDLTQETFLKAFVHISECKHSSIKAWLFKVAYHLYLDMVRKERKILYDLPIEDVMDTLNIENQIIADMNYLHFLKMIDGMPEYQKTALYLCDISNIEQTEVAQILKISHPALRNLLLRARRKIRTMIQEEKQNDREFSR